LTEAEDLFRDEVRRPVEECPFSLAAAAAALAFAVLLDL
jgi:hypothetical protein